MEPQAPFSSRSAIETDRGKSKSSSPAQNSLQPPDLDFPSPAKPPTALCGEDDRPIGSTAEPFPARPWRSSGRLPATNRSFDARPCADEDERQRFRPFVPPVKSLNDRYLTP